MREEFQAHLDDLAGRIGRMAAVADEMMTDALEALTSHDPDRAQAVVDRDVEVDRDYVAVQESSLRLIATQGPVAGDLRRLVAFMHVSIHVERMADYAVSVARRVKHAGDLTDDAGLSRQLHEMGAAARDVGRTAVRAFLNDDDDTARSLVRLDEDVDGAFVELFQALTGVVARDPDRLAWATDMLLVPKLLERYADHGVDIGEQTVFVVTGEITELTSPS